MKKNQVVFPGEYLCDLGEEFIPGFGCQVVDDRVFACIHGKIRFRKVEKDENHKLVCILSDRTVAAPKAGSIVFGRVVNVNLNMAKVRILCVDGVIIDNDSFLGTINKRDVRETEIDKVRILDSYVPGDVVKGKVLTMGAKKICHLTTARKDFGVVFGTSRAGSPLKPLEERIGICTTTNVREKRKFALRKKIRKRRGKRKKRY